VPNSLEDCQLAGWMDPAEIHQFKPFLALSILLDTTHIIPVFRKSIEAKYNEVEKALIEDFVRHHRSDDKEKMAELALILSHFRQAARHHPPFLNLEGHDTED